MKHTVNMLRPFFRGLPVIIVVMLLSVTAAKIYLHYATPMYESVAHIKLADAQIGIAHANLYRDFDVFATSSKIGAEVEMLKSQVVIDRALKKLDLGITVMRVGDLHKTELYNECPFSIIARPNDIRGYDSIYTFVVSSDSIIQITDPGRHKTSGKMNRLISTAFIDLLVTRNDSLLKKKPGLLINDRYELTVNAEKTLSNSIREKIDVMNVDKEVPVLRIAYKSPVAQKSADIVNAISEAYINDYIEEKFTAADTTVNFLDKEVNNYSSKLASAERSIENYKEKKGVVNIKQETETNIRSLSELKTRLAGLQMDMIAIDSLARYIKDGRDSFNTLAPNFQTFNDLLSTELIKKIKSLQEEKSDLLLKYTPTNIKVQVVDSKLNDLYLYMEESVNNTRTNLRLKFYDLKKTIREAEATMEGYPSKDRNMTVLDRNFNLNDQIYRFLREKRTDAEIARAASISFHRVISKAEVAAKPVSPVPSLLKVLGGFLGFVFGTLAIYIVHFLKGRVNNGLNIERNSEIPIQTGIPFLITRSHARIVFQKLAIDLEVKKSLVKDSVLTITSFDRSEGKKTIALGLARAILSLGKTCVILDADGGLAAAKTAGFPSVEDQRDFPEIFPVSDWGDQWYQPKTFSSIIGALKMKYDVVLLATAPLAANASSLLMLGPATMTLFVLDSRKTRLKRVEEANLMQQELQLHNFHFVLNRDGYNPGLISQAYRRITRLFKGNSKTSIL